ncbi:hypothetical protein AURDEDRAFT_116827 [Auricularia subglabra TFB-10046 SS5]|uniref:Uncharacterized protein n=1 Tax=Auricularia subglabra (strain TFB-10046 / SS5) TaxID=717982 RepID=J0LHE0_AURST|nr:hypothetical protein AURDEDRAFT_116827 [Auricularia subglabra TFB-10046 SS5]
MQIWRVSGLLDLSAQRATDAVQSQNVMVLTKRSSPSPRGSLLGQQHGHCAVPTTRPVSYACGARIMLDGHRTAVYCLRRLDGGGLPGTDFRKILGALSALQSRKDDPKARDWRGRRSRT